MRELIKWPPTFRQLYLLLMLAILVSLPLSKYVASASQILLFVAWLAEGNFRQKWLRFRSRPAIALFMGLFLVHLAGMLWTSDVGAGWHDIKIKLPLLMLPLVLGTIDMPGRNEKALLLGAFVVGVFISVIAGFVVIQGWVNYEVNNFRDASIFISHIRFALLIDLAVFILFYYAFEQRRSLIGRLALLTLTLFLVAFLFMLKSLTGVVVLLLGGWLLAFRWTVKQGDQMARWFLTVALVTLPLLVILYGTNQVSRFYTIHDNWQSPDRETVNGNPYWHDTSNLHLENGHFVGLYLCEDETREAWNRISTYDYDGLDRKGQEIKYTLRRYLTSMGYRKDSVGVSRLMPDDVRLIEDGYANSRYKEPQRFSNRIYELIWEVDVYRKGGNPSGHSVTQRLEFLKAGWAIFKDQPVFGVGTGDLQQSFDDKYIELDSSLDPKWRLRAHNQFLTFAIALGLVGFFVAMGALIIPPIIEKRQGSYFFLMFILVGLLSMLNEDTLETQAGVAFFAFFYSFFTFFHERN